MLCPPMRVVSIFGLYLLFYESVLHVLTMLAFPGLLRAAKSVGTQQIHQPMEISSVLPSQPCPAAEDMLVHLRPVPIDLNLKEIIHLIRASQRAPARLGSSGRPCRNRSDGSAADSRRC